MTDYQDYDEYGDLKPKPDKSIKGYQIVVVILAIILGGLSFLYVHNLRQIKDELSVTQEDKDTLTSQYSALVADFSSLKTENDTISYQMGVERGKADSLMLKLTSERKMSYAKIRQYEKELGTLRNVMRGFVYQIDSLNTLNKSLIQENIGMRTQVTTQRMRADVAEERASELDTKVKQGAVVRARAITLTALSSSDKEVTRASRANRLRVDFALTANDLANPGPRSVYARITGPDGYILASSSGSTFSFEGDKLTYSASREIDYQNADLPVGLFYNGSGITDGKYKVAIYMDGRAIGSSEVILR